jgi:ElaB/YqjD/DUF883 family membrane-anchored ribosome-binding protein
MAAGMALMMTKTRVGLSDLWSGNQSNSMGSGRHFSPNAPSMTSRMSESIDELREAAGDYTQRARDYVSETTDTVTQQSSQMIEKARSTVQENVSWMLEEQPLVLGAIGLAAGAIIGAILPETEMENRTLGTARDELAETAKSMAKDRVDALKSMAGEVGERVGEVMGSNASSGQSSSTSASQGMGMQSGSSGSKVGGGSAATDEKSNTARSTTRSGS